MYFILKEPKSKNKTLIFLRFYVAKEKTYFKISTNIKINPDNWSKKNRLPVRKRGLEGVESEQITSKLLEINKVIQNLKYKFAKDLSIGDLKLAFNKKEENIYFLDYFESFIKEKDAIGELAKRSIQKYDVVLKKLIDFEVHKKSNYKLTEIKRQFFIDLIIFLRDQHDLHDNTLARYISVIKTFLRWALKKGYSPPMDFLDVVVKPHETDDVALTNLEVKLIENAVLNETQDRCRDLFLIGVYSGQRWSDYSCFDKSDLRDNIINKRAKKTGSMSYIPLHDKLKAILDKYDWILPKISSQKFNIHIQKICKALEINDLIKFTHSKGNKKTVEVKQKWEKIGSHTARRTFITLAAEQNMPDHLIMRITGIKDPNTLKKYKKTNTESIEKHIKAMFLTS